MEGPRAPAEQEYQELVEFLNSSLRPGSSWSISTEYPTAITEKNLANIRIIKDGSKVLSHAVIKPLVIKTPVMVVKAAAIGSVVTDSRYRQQGLSQKILEECIQSAKDQNCDFAILWTNLYDFYRKFGFELAGTEVSALIDQKLELEKEVPLKFVEGPKVDPNAILKLYTRHTVASVRNLEEVRKCLNIPNSRIYTAWDEQGNIKAYAIEGKGADLDGYIHEWGGGVQEILQLLNYIQSKQNRALTMIVPSHSMNLLNMLKKHKVHLHDGYLGMIRVIDHNAFFKKINRHVQKDLGYSEFSANVTENGYEIGLKGSMVKLSDEKELAKLIFGPQRPSDIHKMDPKVLEVMDYIFPLRMWFWGWDSV